VDLQHSGANVIKPFTDVIYQCSLKAREKLRSGVLLKGRLQALPINTGLGYKGLHVTNTLVNYQF
jgi:hypothetical protein